MRYDKIDQLLCIAFSVLPSAVIAIACFPNHIRRFQKYLKGSGFDRS